MKHDARLPVGDVTRGLETTSDKIRALAQVGYDRTEISLLLGKRYQHIRKVLVDAGITGGLRRQVEAAREPVVVDATPAPQPTTSWEVLLSAGFRVVGTWRLDDETKIKFDGTAPLEPGVYAFVVDDVVTYVGLTNNGLRARFDQYRRGHEKQRTNARVHKLIEKKLLEGQRVKALIATPEPLEWNGLPVNAAAWLEAGLTEMIRPVWNIAGAT